jgi:uncharacterized DUF497 family protein
MISFEWDETKSKTNLQKHGISFVEAQTVFYDENAVEFFDESHFDAEGRFIMLGFSSHLRLLVVCHCFRRQESIIRIISARRATKTESKYYGG